MTIFQHPLTPMPPMQGGPYGGNKGPQGGGKMRKNAEHCQNQEMD